MGLWGLATGSGFESALLVSAQDHLNTDARGTGKKPGADPIYRMLQAYKGSGAGAGDILMNFLGIVILSFGFRVYSQRDLMASTS